MTIIPRLHVVTDDSILGRDGWPSLAAAVLEAGLDGIALHIRGPATDGATVFDLTARLLPEARRSGAWLIVNDRVDVALTADADGVHLGVRSLSVPQARRVLGEDKRIGVSAHCTDEVAQARREGADYAFMGTIYPTPSHEGIPGMGIDGFRDGVEHAGRLPILGIGGVGLGQVVSLMRVGASGVAVMRGVWDHPDPPVATTEYLDRIEEMIDE